ncbi:RNA polymerase sigma factor [Streptomyces marincola]|uniref:RNA polymerase sigma factor n=1 Tax=Streptomyces marincola TaxID=2878388 RepID=UPI001CF43C28|nr:sigma-70 family RNA polymerase sigma factor [Streptomyces marincola]UCM89728.1 sigma-70 family RNA polymerase sigma factor [Streptomyces marincola]
MAGARGVRPAGGDAGDTDDVGLPLSSGEDVSRIRAVLVLGGVPWNDLEDALQQVRVKLLTARADPARAHIRNPGAWLSVVASRVAADWHRERAREAGLRARLATRWAVRPPPHPQEDQALALAVSDALAELPLPQRQVLTLRFYVDLTVRDIALVLGVPEGTVKSRLHAAVSLLRDRLGEKEVIRDDDRRA